MDTYTLPILLEGEHWTLTSVRLKVLDRTVTVEAACPVGEALLPGLDRVEYTGINMR